jgi:predicted phage tail protein
MSTVIVTLSTKQQVFPAGTVPAGIKFSLSDSTIQPQTVSTAPYSASFSDIAPGTYTATAQAVDASGNALGDPATSAEFTVAAPVMVDVPDVITVTVNA